MRPGWRLIVGLCWLCLAAPGAFAQSDPEASALEATPAAETGAKAPESVAADAPSGDAIEDSEKTSLDDAAAAEEEAEKAQAEASLWRAANGVGLDTTASRMGVEPIAQVPLSIRSYDDQELHSREIWRLNEIGFGAANVEYGAMPGSTRDSRIYIRGIGMDNSASNVDPGVGLYVDGVYVPRATNALLDVVDVDGIEILRGVQGTRYGKNLNGGAIYVRSRRPGHDFGGMGDLNVGSDGLLQGTAALDIPIKSGWFEDRLFTRWTFMGRTDDGYVTNTRDGGDSGQDNLLGGRVALELLATDDLHFELIADIRNQKERDPAGRCQLGEGNVYARYLTDNFNGPVGNRFPDQCAQAFAVNRNVGYANPLTRHTTNTVMTSFGAEYDLGRFTSSFADRFALRSRTGFWYRDDETTGGDGDGAPIAYLGDEGGDAWHWTISEDLSANMAFLDDRIDFLIGAFIMKEKAQEENESNMLRSFAVGNDPNFMGTPETYPNGAQVVQAAVADGGIAALGTSLSTILSNYFTVTNPQVLRNGQADAIATRNYTREQDWEHTEYAGYAHADVELVDRFSLDGGVRYTVVDKSRDSTDTGVFCRQNTDFVFLGLLIPRPQVPVAPLANGSCAQPTATRALASAGQSHTFSGVSGDAALRYDLDPGMLFFRYARGFKSGGFTTETIDQALLGQLGDPGNAFDTRYESETMDSFELGAKLSFFDESVFLNTSIFWNLIDDLQVSSIESDGVGYFRTQINNAEEATIRGFEAEGAWVPDFEWLPGPDATLAITGGIGAVNAVYDTYEITAATSFVSASQCSSLVRGSTGCPPLPPPPDAASATLTQLPIDQVAIYTALSMMDFIPVETRTYDASGQHFANVPQVNVNGAFHYAFNPVKQATLGFRFDYAYRSTVQYSASDSSLRDGQLHVMNALLSVDVIPSNTQLTFWVKNLTDQESLNGGLGSAGVLGSQQLYYTPPRTFGLNLRQTF